MKNKKFLKVLVFSIIILCLMSTVCFATNLGLSINCDGKTITMESDTTDMTYNINNILPGESNESSITITNNGSKDVVLAIDAELLNDDKKLCEVLSAKLTDASGNKYYEGNYTDLDLEDVSITLIPGQTQTFTITSTMPKTVGNEYQEATCTVKLYFQASAEVDTVEEESEEPVIITTTEVVKPTTGQSRVIYLVLAILLIAVIIIIIKKCVDKSKNSKK